MDQFLDLWHSYRFRYCSVNNSGLCIIVLTGCSSSKKVENIEREQIIGTLYNVSESAVSYPDIPSLTKNSEIIIYGEVVQTESVTPENGIARAWRSNNLFFG